MIDGISYDEILKVSQELKNCCTILKKVIAGKDLSELEDFISTVDVYYKYLDSTVELNKDADLELQNLKDRKS